ncbi:radial spoke head protein 9 homolog isoform X1 [Synchiropus splendidus]|uniref:radial spoke head protein 9 homolog isoform X1 n=1 Tax=Synchiropus splendidus TaxID=270530 RepID=UPI00237D47EB|nr:radial spoke head protein 9 homolog isoform X1 [Synchiropus splendidus]
METNTLSHFLEMVAGSGCTLNMEQRTILQTSLILLRKKEQFKRVLFWGKIMGRVVDYFIVQGRGEDELKDKKYLYSINCLEWFTLPRVTDTMIEQVAIKAKGRFYGDPAHVYEADDENEKTRVTEEHRLAVAVHQIESEVSVVPRGAFIKMARGMVQVNRSFAGLSYTEAAKLENYLHFTEPQHLKNKSLLEMADLNPAYDFLDPLSVDVPNGWCLQFECARTVCTIRSLLWPGLIFYHVPMTVQYGYIYIGDGLRNLDLPFML